MHKSFVFLKRRANIERSIFFRWWLDVHPLLIEKVPGLCRYTASLEAGGDDGAFDGLGEFWFDDVEAASAGLATSAGRLLDADMRAHASRIECVPLVEHSFLDTREPAPFKLIAALKRRADLTRAEFASWWLERHAPLVVVFPELRRYCVNIVQGEPEAFADGIAEVAFADLESLKRVTSSAQVKGVQGDSQLHTSARFRLLVEEHTILG